MPDVRETAFTFQVNDATECFVGWDPMLGTFFGQVYLVDAAGERIEEDGKGQDGTFCWVGTRPAEIRTVDHLAETLRSFAVLPADVRAKLFVIEID